MNKDYCDDCDITINKKSKSRHLLSQNHSQMKSYVRQSHDVGDIYWKDFYNTNRKNVNNNRLKFLIFKTKVSFNLFDKDLVIWLDNTKKRLSSYCYGDDVFHYLNPVCEKIQDRIRCYALKSGKVLYLETVMKDVSITFYSYYYLMHPTHKLFQPRRVLESQLLKHMLKLTEDEKCSKYKYLYRKYRTVSYDDNIVHFCITR